MFREREHFLSRSQPSVSKTLRNLTYGETSKSEVKLVKRFCCTHTHFSLIWLLSGDVTSVLEAVGLSISDCDLLFRLPVFAVITLI
jgi:hypothetical protein